MKTDIKVHKIIDLDMLCNMIRELVHDGLYEKCIEHIAEAMATNPHAPEPHNLLGIVLEKQGDHPKAMKHFRAAWALDPTYKPARHNLDTYGTFFSRGRCAFDESDLPPESESNIEIVYDEKGIGHVVSKNKIQYDKNGVGRIVRR